MDPLRPFAALIRSLRTSRIAKTERSGASATSQSLAGLADPHAVSPLRSKLRARLSAMPSWDSQRARELFVECALTAELGEDLVNDPAFTELTRRVETHLSQEPRISARLDELLREIAKGDVR